MRLWERFTIMGCEGRGDGDSAYLTRYRFPRIGPIRPALHIFHRSDHDEMHDHPWPFVSIILWRGYIEETPVEGTKATKECRHCAFFRRTPAPWCSWKECPAVITERPRKRKRVWPGMILYRPATHIHRVVLVDGKKAVTLVIMGRRCREWGFWTRLGWQRFREYFKENGC